MGVGIMAALFPPKKEPLAEAKTATGFTAEDRSEYLKWAKKAGFSHADVAVAILDREVDEAKLRQFLAENGICVYDEKRVHRYMDSITPSYKTWGWHRLEHREDEASSNGCYTKPIPLPVLMTVAKIREAFPEARFWVTDIAEIPKGDPFLSVGVGEERFIIERWDEPGFRS